MQPLPQDRAVRSKSSIFASAAWVGKTSSVITQGLGLSVLTGTLLNLRVAFRCQVKGPLGPSLNLEGKVTPKLRHQFTPPPTPPKKKKIKHLLRRHNFVQKNA